MATYLRDSNLRNTTFDPNYDWSASWKWPKNPWSKKPADDELDEFRLTPWQLWFLAVDSANHDALKTKVPAAFHDLLDGKEPCPVCGKPLGYRPWLDRNHMIELCPACGHVWCCVTWEEKERSEHWVAWQHAHGEAANLGEFWALKAKKRKAEEARAKQEEEDAKDEDAGATVIPWKDPSD
jgi:hypothetical protein